jgi:Tubulin-tyrosine ligase family
MPSTCRQTFQYFGLDFLVDAALKPWLMEVNATPSMKVAHQDANTAACIHTQKAAFIADTFALLRLSRHTFDEARIVLPNMRMQCAPTLLITCYACVLLLHPPHE